MSSHLHPHPHGHPFLLLQVFYFTVGEHCCRRLYMIWKLTNMGSGDKNASTSGIKADDHPYSLFNSQAGQTGHGHATCAQKEEPLFAYNRTLFLIER